MNINQFGSKRIPAPSSIKASSVKPSRAEFLMLRRQLVRDIKRVVTEHNDESIDDFNLIYKINALIKEHPNII